MEEALYYSGRLRFASDVPGPRVQKEVDRVIKELGLDLSAFHPGTLNVSTAPLRHRVVQPKLTFRDVKWHPTEPAEDFSFFDVTLYRAGAIPVCGMGSYCG